MHLLAFSSLLLALRVSSSHVSKHIPEVEDAVTSALNEYHSYTAYKGSDDPAATPAPTAAPKASPGSTNSAGAPYWLEQIKHQGIAAFNPDTSYKTFRNVKDFGAKGDGVTDDTAAIQLAISSGNRCAPGKCQSSTITPAVVYFPSGTYIISSSIVDYYFTQLIGNPNSRPILKATPNFSGFGLIDGDQYQAGGVLGFGATNVFYRQVRNFVLDMTAIPAGSAATGIHWPTAQATSVQNVIFRMSDAPGTKHQGFFIESGSAGFMNDLEFYGGLNGAVFGNQQYTVRNLKFYNAVTAITMLFDWGWTYKSILIENCTTGFDVTSGGHDAQNIGSVTIFDSSISNTAVGIKSVRDATSKPPTGGSIILENVQLNNVPVAVQGPNNTTKLAGTTGATTIAAWGSGHEYIPNGPIVFEGDFQPIARPGSLLRGGKYYERSKPQYENLPVTQFLSARDAGARGDGIADDTAAVQKLINNAASSGKIAFFDAGIYKVTKTIQIPPGSKIVGETYPLIMSSGKYFANMKSPKPVVQVGKGDEDGSVEWSDMVVSTQGSQGGAILIEWNLATSGTPSGMWDVHTRIGGFAGSELQVAQCPTTPTVATPPAPIDPNCIAAFMSIHITEKASNLYLENTWFWTADHDLDDPTSTQITIYAGRGMLIDSKAGTIWLWGTAVEHHTLYQYQFSETQNIFMGQVQTETAYYQPNPPATIPFPVERKYDDPDFAKACLNRAGNCAMGWGLRIIDSQNILGYGVGLYSFFDNYSTTCSNAGNGETCQTRIFSLEGRKLRNVEVYNLNTIGATSMIDRDGKSLASFADNINVFPDTIALFKSN